MLEKIKKVMSRCKLALAGAATSVAVMGLTIASGAEEVIDGTFITDIVNTAGNSLLSSIKSMVTALVPILVGAAMAGFAVFGAKWIFSAIKGFLTKGAA